MSILEAILLGLVQGLTEFIPVSSSGHLVLMQQALGTGELGLTFDVALHFGTFLALVVYFWRDLVELGLGLLGKNDKQRLAWLIAAATVPAAIVGVLIQDAAETSLRSPYIVSGTLIGVGVLMLVAEDYATKRNQQTDIKKISPTQAIGVGLAQALALVPGVSRSGSTITAGLFLGLERVAATRYSFLLAIPITFGAIVKIAMDTGTSGIAAEAGIFATGIITACLSGLVAIRFLLRYLSTRTLAAFAYYRIGLGIIVLMVLGVR